MRIFIAFLVLFLCLAHVHHAQAQVLTPLQTLSFGEAVVKNNNAQHEIVVATDGGYTNDPEIAFIATPVEAIFRLSGATPGQTIDSVDITIDQQMIGAGEDFILDNFTVDAPATADGSGQAIISVGARMRTTGNMNSYQSSTAFSGMFTIEVNLL